MATVVIAVMNSCGSPGHVSATATLVESDCYSGGVKPNHIVLACGDGNAVAKDLKWSTWNNQFASGEGAVSQNNCAPDCAQGRFIDYPARIQLSEVVAVTGHRFFTRVTITYGGPTPTGEHVQVLKDCFDNPPHPDIPRCPTDLQGGQH